MKQLYAVVSPTNGILSVQPDEAKAVAEGRRRGRRVTVDRSVQLGPIVEQNPLGPRGPEEAWRNVGHLRINANEALSMSLGDAHRRLLPYFPTRDGNPVKAWSTPLEMVNNLLGTNKKTAARELYDYQSAELRRRFGKEGISIEGLTLLPNVLWSRITKSTTRVNTCVGASKECIQACLVYSGHNTSDPYNTVIKTAKLTALLKDPNAFGAMLFHACRRHLQAPRASYAGFVRLNVFSDIPWELVFPELFGNVQGQFFDYTKVPYRKTPSNYDLTFSYSGRNYEDMTNELRRGHRVAVVFLTKPNALPSTFLGFPVVDGTLNDARPLDPAPVIVGLVYKIAKGQAVNLKDNVFVVPVQEIDGQVVAALVPRDQPGVVEGVNAEDAVPRGTRLPIIQNRRPNMTVLHSGARKLKTL